MKQTDSNYLFNASCHNYRPTDTEFMFDTFLSACKDPKAPVQFPVRKLAPKVGEVKKILLLGSGGTSIGQAGEFDYSGGQAIKVRFHVWATNVVFCYVMFLLSRHTS